MGGGLIRRLISKSAIQNSPKNWIESREELKSLFTQYRTREANSNLCCAPNSTAGICQPE